MNNRRLLKDILDKKTDAVYAMPIFKTGYVAGIIGKPWLNEVTYSDCAQTQLETGVIPSVKVGEKEYFPQGHLLAFNFTPVKFTDDYRIYEANIQTRKGPLSFEIKYTRNQYGVLTKSFLDDSEGFCKLLAYLEEVYARTDDVVENLGNIRKEIGDDCILQFFLPQPFEMYCLASREEAIYLKYDESAEFEEFKKLSLEVTTNFIEKVSKSGYADLFLLGSAGSELYSPGMFDEEFMPSSVKMIDKIRECGAYSTFHACGNMKVFFNNTEILKLKPDIFEGVAYAPSGDLTKEDIDKIDKHCAIRGNIDLGLLRNECEDVVYENAMNFMNNHKDKQLILSGSCDVLFGTPKRNVIALKKACDDFNRLNNRR